MPYTPIHNYRRKDSLTPGDPDKIIYGADLQDEFDAIAENLDVLSQIDIDGDGNINIPPELIEGLIEALDGKVDQSDLEAEIRARIEGDKALQDQIDSLGGGGGGASSWDEITGKPSTFPPEAHTHGWDQVTGKPTEYPPEAHDHGWDSITGKPSEYPPESHEHSQSEIDGLEDRLDQIEDSINSGGGFVDAPNDGKLYGRQSEDWEEVVIPEVPEIPDMAGMVISETEPAEDERATGMQWLDVGGDEPFVWIWDEDKWVEFPAGKASGGSDTTYTLPVAVRGGDIQLPLNQDSSALIVDTRSGPVELPLAA